MTPREKEVLRGLLHRRWLTAPVLVYGLLGGDPNDFTVEEHVRIVGWLHELGYERRVSSRFQHATLMAVWAREEMWPGEETGSGGGPVRAVPADPALGQGELLHGPFHAG